MMDLHDIQERIRSIQREAERQNHDAALELRDELIYDIIQDDAGLYIIIYSETFLAAPVRESDSRDFLRAFSDEALAKARASELDGARVEKLSSLDFLRLSKSLFLQGVYGVALNEGDVWTAAPLHDCLRVFLERALPESPMYSEEFVSCVQLISAVRKNASNGLVCAVCDGSVNIDSAEGTAGYIFSEGEATLPVDSAVLYPVDLQTLFHFSGTVRITMKGQAYSLDGRLLADALAACGVAQDSDAFEPAQQFFDEPSDLRAECSAYKEIKDLSLCFPTHEQQSDEQEGGDAAALMVMPEKQETHGPKRLSNILRGGWHFLHGAWSSVARAAAKKGRELAEWPRRKRRLGIGAAVFLLLVSIGGTTTLLRSMHHTHTRELFRAELDGRDFASAYRLYLENGYGAEEDRYVAEEIDNLISGYTHDTITAPELEASLSALSMFPNQAAKLESAHVSATRLAVSKMAYEQGSATEDVVEKLLFWQDVIPLDEANYSAVRRATEANRDNWLPPLLGAVRDSAYSDRERAAEIAGIAAGYYPDDPDVAAWCETFQNERLRAQLGEYPIHISSISLRHGGEFDSVSLYIKWENTSVKAIDSLAFLFRFYDEAGEVVSYKKRGEVISVFKGEESADAPYDPGYAVSSDSWGWSGLWKGKGSLITTAKLNAVQVNFADGSAETYADGQELLRMQS